MSDRVNRKNDDIEFYVVKIGNCFIGFNSRTGHYIEEYHFNRFCVYTKGESAQRARDYAQDQLGRSDVRILRYEAVKMEEF